jgi:hypothetical protein
MNAMEGSGNESEEDVHLGGLGDRHTYLENEGVTFALPDDLHISRKDDDALIDCHPYAPGNDRLVGEYCVYRLDQEEESGDDQ